MTNTWTYLAFELIQLGQAYYYLEVYMTMAGCEVRDIAGQTEVSAEIGCEAMAEESELHSSRVSSLVDTGDDVHVDCDVGGIRAISVHRNWTRGNARTH